MELPTNDIQIASRLQIVKQLRSLQMAVQSVKTQVIHRSVALYEAFRHPDPEKWGRVTIQQAARFVFGEKTRLQMHHDLAIHQLIHSLSTHFVMDGFTMLSSRTFYTRPTIRVQNLELVANWVRTNGKRS